MKKRLLVLAAMAAALTMGAQKPHKYVTEQWTGSGWDSLYVNTYTYNSQFHRLADDQVDFDGVSWVNFSRNTYSNTSAGSPTLQLGELWDTGTSAWGNNSRTTTTYTGSKVLTSTVENWNGSAFVNENKETHYYDGNLFETSTLYQTWNGAWENSILITYTNDVSGTPTELYQQQWDGSAWTDVVRATMTNTLTKPLSAIYEYWDGSVWFPVLKYTNTYDANLNLTSMLFEFFDGSTWENTTMYTYTYDSYGNQLVSLTENWNTAAMDWEPAYRTTAYHYATMPAVQTLTVNNITQVSAVADASVSSDGGMNTTRGICYSTSPNPLVTDMNVPSGSGIGPFTATLTGLTYNTTYYVRAYATNTAGTVYGDELSFKTDLDAGFDPAVLNAPFRVYPQPAGDVLNIQSLTGTPCLIFDISGRPVQEISINRGTTTVDVSKLPPGVYFLGEKSKGVKFIKQ